MIFHIDGVLIIGRISQIPSWWNIECKVTIFFANTQILDYLCKIFEKKSKSVVVNRIGGASNGQNQLRIMNFELAIQHRKK